MVAGMRLTELEPEFLRYYEDHGHVYHKHVSLISEANGLWFLCPKCFKTNGSRVGTHGLICWDPSVPQSARPGPGRWRMVGTSFEDLTLRSSSSHSVLLTDGCEWHGFVENGEVRDA